MSVLAQSQRFGMLPSQIMRIDDEYTAYCFDEACALIMSKLDNKEEIRFEGENAGKSFSNFSDFYSQYE